MLKYKKNLLLIYKKATKANNEILLSQVAKQVGGLDNPWLVISKYNNAVEKCVQDMLPKWENKLGGARELMSTHCFTMSSSVRVDLTVQALSQNSTFVYK